MTITIDAAGRVVIPQAIRRRLGLVAGTELEVDETDGGVVLRPTSVVRIETAADGLPILRVAHGTDELTTSDVRRLVEEGRAWEQP